MSKQNDIECLRRHLKEGQALLKRLEAGENPSPTSTPQQKRKQLINKLLSTNERVKKKDILSL